MSKFDKRPVLPPTAPITTTDSRALTHEGGVGYVRDAKSELFLLAVTNMVSEDTFYESGKTRDARFKALVHQVTAEDPAWMQGFIPWLRDGANMRSASVIAAVEYAKAGGRAPRAVVNAALQRADEPGDAIAYLFSEYGRKLSGGLQRGIADAVTRLYTERAALRYDGKANTWRMGDVIELVHPTPSAEWQSALFKYLLDKRHHPDDAERAAGTLTTIGADVILRAMPEGDRRAALDSDIFRAAGWNFERLSGWLPGGMDAAAWEAAIPSMGYMSLLRNLRNFDDAKISDEAAQYVMTKLADPDEVARSRQFPYRFFSAYMEVASLRWAPALERALSLSVQGIPEVSGKSLVLIDTSGSMRGFVSGRSKRMRYELAALFAGALAQKSEHVDLVHFADLSRNHNELLRLPLLRLIEGVGSLIGEVGYGTAINESIRQHYAGHDRVFVFTDEQSRDTESGLPDVPIYMFNLGGYRTAFTPSGARNRYTFGGFNDSVFKMVPLLEGAARDAAWPWE